MPYLNFYTSDGNMFMTSDGLEFVVPVYATDTLFYDSIDLMDAARTEGYISGGIFNTTNVNLYLNNLVDQYTGPMARLKGSGQSGVRFTLAAQKTIDFFAVYISTAIYGYTFKVFGSNTAGSGYTELISTDSIRIGWRVFTFTPGTYQYIVFQVEKGTIDVRVSELIIGESWQPSRLFDVGDLEGDEPLVMINKTTSGVEYAIKKAEPKTGWDYIFTGIDPTLKGELESLRKALGGTRKKFIYYPDDYKYVKLTKDSLRFINLGGNYFQTRMNMREQNG